MTREARQDLARFRGEIRVDLPTLQNMDKALRTILFELRQRLVTGEDWRNPSCYSSLALAEREAIRSAELTVAGFKFFELGKIDSCRPLVAEIRRGLGQFYASRFVIALVSMRTGRTCRIRTRANFAPDRC